MKSLLFILFYCSFPVMLYAQTLPDSIEAKINHYPKDSLKAEMLIARGDIYLKNQPDNSIVQIKNTRQPVGYFTGNLKPYEHYESEAIPGDCFYLFSDSYANQFGGPRGKKFSYKKFKQLLLEHYQKPMPEQKILLTSVFDKWKKEEEQIDDVCVMVVRCS